jgi:hypothetical protein
MPRRQLISIPADVVVWLAFICWRYLADAIGLALFGWRYLAEASG